MHRLILLLIACLIGCQFGCEKSDGTTRPATTTTTAATQAVLLPVELHYGIYLARSDLRITVSADGLLRSVSTSNKSYGPKDIDPKHQRVEIREGKLTDEQIAELVRLFAGWESLSSEPYSGVPDGGSVSIRYGDKLVSGGSAVPKQVTDVRIRLTEIAYSMPVKKA